MSSKKDYSQYPSRTATPTIGVRFKAEVREQLEAVAKIKGTSLSELVRQLVEQSLDQCKSSL